MRNAATTHGDENHASKRAKRRPNRRLTEVVQLWVRWVGVLAKVAGQKRGPLWISADEYRGLHSHLTKALVSKKAADDLSEDECDLCRRMEHLCRPWLSLENLQHTDRRVLRDVARNARSLHYELCGDHGRYRRLLVVALCFVGLAGAGALLMWFAPMDADGGNGVVSTTLAESLRGLWYRVLLYFGRQEYVIWIAVGVGLMLMIGLFTLRSARSY